MATSTSARAVDFLLCSVLFCFVSGLLGSHKTARHVNHGIVEFARLLRARGLITHRCSRGERGFEEPFSARFPILPSLLRNPVSGKARRRRPRGGGEEELMLKFGKNATLCGSSKENFGWLMRKLLHLHL
ncbi:hypothetical protein GGI42DRAFT_289332 [Trichoderma sp. SZMC 28013]